MLRLYTLLTRLLHSIKQSIILDGYFLTQPLFSFSYKISFLFEKYRLIIKYLTSHQFTLGKNFAIVRGQKIYYNAPFGLAPYQYILKTMLPIIRRVPLGNSSVIFDVGANVGYFSLIIKQYAPSAEIYCFEPVPETYTALENNSKQTAGIFAYDLALSNHNSFRTINFSPLHNELSKIDDSGNLRVKAETLDNFIAKNNIKNIDLLKIDTESHERQVLEGASNTLKITRNILIEITVHDNTQYTFSSLVKLLSTTDYNFQLLQIRPVPSTSAPDYMDCLFTNILLAT